jgi:hypothetical protein
MRVTLITYKLYTSYHCSTRDLPLGCNGVAPWLHSSYLHVIIVTLRLYTSYEMSTTNLPPGYQQVAQ